ncbi:ER membrane protein complex subunit 3 [Diplonema papillatum]|nr:ER membrane protein complex subunit 3 [Diplonema papillatum]
MQEVLLDPGIREWALIPIVVVTLLLQLLKHYIALLMKSPKQVSAEYQRETQTLQRSTYTRANREFIPLSSVDERRKKFREVLAVASTSEEGSPMAAFSDPMAMRGMMVQQFLSIGPHFGMMTWVSYFFSGFVIAKLPFPLTSRFRGMLQRGIEHPTLEVTYITSVCGYFLFMFGLRGIITLVLGEASEFDDTEHLRNMSEGGAGGPPTVDMTAMFNSEKENWSEALTGGEFRLNGSEKRLLALPARVS